MANLTIGKPKPIRVQVQVREVPHKGKPMKSKTITVYGGTVDEVYSFLTEALKRRK